MYLTFSSTGFHFSQNTVKGQFEYCDGNQDCEDVSDEPNTCKKCDENQFQCTKHGKSKDKCIAQVTPTQIIRLFHIEYFISRAYCHPFVSIDHDYYSSPMSRDNSAEGTVRKLTFYLDKSFFPN